MVTWRFEREDEFFTVAQIRDLFKNKKLDLLIPYLPYARQDKKIANDHTFALHTFASLLNELDFSKVMAWDVHNPALTEELIWHFVNVSPEPAHKKLLETIKANTVIFPDAGAASRYPWLLSDQTLNKVVYKKKRDQATGKITGLERSEGSFLPTGGPCLIVDDICDGGATFLGIHEAMKAEGIRPEHALHLFVTHGIFSKGRDILQDAGITLWTTDSLPRNQGAMSLSCSHIF